MSKRLILTIAVAVIFLSSAGIVTFLSAQEGAGATAAPAARTDSTVALETRYAPDRVYRGAGTMTWRVSRDLGVLLSTDGGTTWESRNTGLPTRAVYPFTTEHPPIITGLSLDPYDPSRVGISTLDTVFLSSDDGLSWSRLDLRDPIRANDQLTCVALQPGNPNGLLVGTSFHGFFESKDRGRTWVSLSDVLVPLKLGGGNSEEIASLAYDPIAPDLVWFALGFGKGLYTFRKGTKTADSIPLPVTADPDIRDISFHRAGPQDAWTLDVRVDTARWTYAPGVGTWRMAERIQPETGVTPEKAARLAQASGRYGIYVSSRWASGDLLKRHLAFLKAQGLNSIVVDMKDDDGYVTYDTGLEEPAAIGAVRKRFKLDELLTTAHDAGLYVIGRIVTFRDKQLYNAYDFKYAAWDTSIKGPWRYLKTSTNPDTGEETTFQGEYWVDPYSDHVWDYNIAIARELQDRGVDEVQFDYIRFPSDGNIGGITWRYRRPNMGKLEALESFLAKARENLTFPISTDVYGYAGWARISNWVAQNIETYSRYVDVIQPM
jgi:hypothetical protein